MLLKSFFILFLYSISIQIYSNENNQNKTFQIVPTILYSSNSTSQGALIWEYPFMLTVVGINFYNKIFLGENGGITLRQSINEKIQLSLSASYENSNGPPGFALKLKKRPLNFRNTRKSAFITSFFISWNKLFFNTRGFLRYRRGFKGFYSDALEVNISKKILPLTSIFIQTGIGSKKHNIYYYGPDAKSGMTYYEYGINFFLPFIPFNGISIINVSKIRVADKQNRKSPYMLENDYPLTGRILLFWPL